MYYDKDVAVWCRSKNHTCMLASVFNAIYLLEGKKQAKDLMKIRHRVLYKKLKDLSKWANFRLRDIALQVVDPSDRFGREWLSELNDGIYLASISGVKGVKHVVTIDADNGRVYDSMEPHPMKKSWNALTACIGDDDTFCTVDEVRSVYKRRRNVQ